MVQDHYNVQLVLNKLNYNPKVSSMLQTLLLIHVFMLHVVA